LISPNQEALHQRQKQDDSLREQVYPKDVTPSLNDKIEKCFSQMEAMALLEQDMMTRMTSC